MSDETFEQVFAVSSPARLVLGNIRGSVDIRPGEPGQIRVSAVKHSDGVGADQTEVILGQDADGTVRAETRYREGGLLFFLRWPCRVDYTVRVPAACTVDVSGVSDAALVEGIQGDIRVVTVSGSLTLRDLSGSIKIRSVSGRVSGERLAGPLEVETVSGGVNLSASQVTALTASTVSGAVVLESPLGEGPYRFKSVSGQVRLIIPAGTACTVRSSSMTGRFTSSLPNTGMRVRSGGSLYQIQGGGPEVRHTSVSGDLWVGPNSGASPVETVFSAEPAAPVDESLAAEAQAPKAQAPVPPAPPEPPGTRPSSAMEILEQIEAGQISVEEGLRRLRR
jgi:hypothetical protein